LLERRWRRLLVVASLTAGGVGLLVAYPYFLDGALARFGVRSVCSALLVLGIVSIALGARARAALGVVAWPSLGIAVVLGVGAASGKRDALLLVPAFVYLGLAQTFRASLSREDSIIERCARYLVPETPDFVRPYCRALTWLWVGFFVACAAVIAGLALAGPAGAWQTVTGWGIYALMLAISALEFFVRKTWFRNYFYNGPFDRFWAKLFPAENTEQGRRSAAYIQRCREEAAGNTGARG
jgi:uncharacterized membrane protein